MIRVLYDWMGFQEPHGGVSRYFTEVIKRLPCDISWEIAATETNNAYLHNPPFRLPIAKVKFSDFLPNMNFRGKRIVYDLLRFGGYERRNDVRSKGKIMAGNFDVLHLTAPHRMPRYWEGAVGRKPIVVTIHDLIPELCGLDRRMPGGREKILNAAAHIIAVSENTKKDILRLYDIPPAKISVIHHGYMEHKNQNSEPPFPGMRYILYVGKRGGYKNSDYLFKALAPLLRADRTLNIVCTGNGFNEPEMTLFIREGIVNQVHQQFIPDSQMMSLYRNAICFVYPSLYEGFGIPILDAFDAGCPVVLSDSSCFPEVAGDAALYFNPADADSLRSAIKSIINNKSNRNSLISKGRERVQQFSWDKCASATADVYRRISIGTYT